MHFTYPLHRAMQRHPDKLAVLFGERQWSYREFVDRVARLAGALRNLGMGAGDRDLIERKEARMLPQLLRDTWMDESIDDFRGQIRRYNTEQLAPHLETWRRQGFIPRDTWRPFGQMGFLLPEINEAYGGAGAPQRLPQSNPRAESTLRPSGCRLVERKCSRPITWTGFPAPKDRKTV